MFAELIYNLRKKHKLTQYELGKKIFVHAGTISKWERGVSTPRPDVIPHLKSIFKLTDAQTEKTS